MSTSKFHVTPRRLLLGAGLLLLSVIALFPLFSHSTLPRGDDVGEHVQFVQDYSAALAQGHLYPRWLPHANLGYGAPAFIFYPPLATAVVSSLHAAGLDLFSSFRTGLLLLTLLAAAAAAWLGVRHSGSSSLWPAFLLAAFWILLPYHALDVFARFALAELATFVFLPLLFLAMDRSQGAHLGGLAVAFAGLCFSHLPTAFLAAWFVMGWALWRGIRESGRAALALVLGAGCSAIYLLPALWERSQIHAGWLEDNPIYKFDSHYLFFPAHTLIRNDPVHGTYQGWLATGTLEQIRIIVPVTLALALGAWLTRILLNRGACAWDPMHRYLIMALAAGAGMTRLADPIWRWIPGFASVVFPWRLTLFLTLAAAALLAALLNDLARRNWVLGASSAATLLALAMFLSSSIARTADWETFTLEHTSSPVVRSRVTGAMMPRSNPFMRGFSRQTPAGAAELLAPPGQEPGSLTILHEETHSRSYGVHIPPGSVAQLLIPQFDYPGWRAEVDHLPVTVLQHPPFGTLAVPLPQGEHHVDVRFEATPVRLLGAALSLLSTLILVTLTIFWHDLTIGVRRPI